MPGSGLNNTALGPAIHDAVIDTGVDYNSPGLRAAFKGGFNFIASDTDPLDDFGHGTHVTGTIVDLVILDLGLPDADSPELVEFASRWNVL